MFDASGELRPGGWPILGGPLGASLAIAALARAHERCRRPARGLEQLPGSSMQARGKLDLAKTPTSLQGSGPAAHATSKLANILFTKELQRRLAGTTATANCFEPGMVRTQLGGFGSDQGLLINLVYKLAKRARSCAPRP